MGYTRLRLEMIDKRAAELNEGPLKTCVECGEEKPLAQFHKKKRNPDGHYDECKVCRRPKVRAVTLFRAWGMTLEEYDGIFEEYQDSKCNICGDPNSYSNGAMGVDHDWECANGCGQKHGCPDCIRGFLCNRCNILLGWMEKFPDEIAAHLLNRPLRAWREDQAA